MDNTENILQSHSERIGKLETKSARHEERIEDLEDKNKEFKEMFQRIEDKLDRPSWVVSALITALFSLATGLIVYIATF